MKYEFDAKNKPSAMYRSGAKNYVSLDGDVKVQKSICDEYKRII